MQQASSSEKHSFSSKREVALLQNVIPDYRVGFLMTLKAKLPENLTIYCGDQDFSSTLKTSEAIRQYTHPVNNRFLFGKKLLWQTGQFRDLVKSDLLILNFNLRILSHYPILLMRWLRRKPTLLWGHIQGRSSLTKRLGFLQLGFAKGFINYTESQRKILQERYPKLATFTASNSCLARKDCYALERPFSEICDVVYVGRMVKDKKPDLLLRSFFEAKSKNKLPDQSKLILVGNGPMLEELQSLSARSEFGQYVQFMGHVADIDKLREIYSTATCSVNPGYVGLTVIQSFAFGVPVLVANNEPHSPEIEACHDLEFGTFFESDSVHALSDSLMLCWEQRELYLARRQEVISYIQRHYTFETMAEGFQKAISYALKEAR